MANEKRDFSKDAAKWDDNQRVRMAADIADVILDAVPMRPGMKVMDFGCGTGLLTLRLQPFAASITGVDGSRGMLDVLEGKIKDKNLSNVSTLHLDPDNGGRLTGSYDLITSSMALHHVRNVPSLLDQLFAVTAPCGHLCIADLDSEGGLFHADNHQGVFSDGFDRDELRRMFVEAGYSDVQDKKATTVVKPVPGGTRDFDIFLMTSYKRA